MSTTPSATTKPSQKSSKTGSTRGVSPKRVSIPGVGTAMQLSCGEIRVRYPDGAQLIVDASGGISYEWRNGQKHAYGPSDFIPDEVKDKLAQMPTVIKYLMLVNKNGVQQRRPMR